LTIESANAAAIATGKLSLSNQEITNKTNQLTSALRQYDIHLQQTTTYSRRQIEQFQSMAIASGINVDSIGTMTKAAIGLSQITGGNLTASLHQLQYALSGNFGMLSRSLPQLKEYKTAQEKMNYIMKMTAGGFKINQNASKTFSGQMIILKNNIASASAQLGKILLPYLQQIVKYVENAIKWFNSLTETQKKWI
jgi:uncharacterized membrane protein